LLGLLPEFYWEGGEKMAKFTFFVDKAGYYRWRLVAKNGEIVAASEGYTSQANAVRSARRVKGLACYAIILE
jgi:uncharacterized protein YegP (UPF0339 family)